jgi:hypothetical protein
LYFEEKLRALFLPVLGDSVKEIVGDSDVECARATGQDVDVVLVVVETHGVRVARAKRTKATAKAETNTKADPPPLAKDDN